MKRQIHANITNDIHRHFEHFDDFEFIGYENVFPCSNDGFC